MSTVSEKYLRKFRRYPRQLSTQPHTDLGIIVVIPCYNEPGLLATLDSLYEAQPPSCAVEVLVVLNSPADAPRSHHQQTQQSLQELETWAVSHNNPRWRVFALHFPALSRKEAGVGTARKIGMDEAVDRFAQIAHEQGIIVCLDADCTCDTTYFQAIEHHFAKAPGTAGATIYYEHPLDRSLSPAHRQAIAEYELHLRYYVHALRFAGLPIACHTVGSTMVVRAKAYCQIGGMNRRKAGEDFYFMQKLAQTQRLANIRETRVLPSPRISDRVPFGTGKAVGDLLSQTKQPHWDSYHPQSFETLALLIEQAPLRFSTTTTEDTHWLQQLPATLRDFLEKQEFIRKLQELRDNTASSKSFQKRLFQWLNLFVAMKWVHYSRDHEHPNIPVNEAASWLLQKLGQNVPDPQEPHTEALLLKFRALEREDQTTQP